MMGLFYFALVGIIPGIVLILFAILIFVLNRKHPAFEKKYDSFLEKYSELPEGIRILIKLLAGALALYFGYWVVNQLPSI